MRGRGNSGQRTDLTKVFFYVNYISKSADEPPSIAFGIDMNKLEEVKKAIPHREPFLFVDEILECGNNRILCKKTFHAAEYFFEGHYPDNPIVPGVLQCEAAMQAGAILLTRIFDKEELVGKLPVVAKLEKVRFREMVRPGDTLLLEVKFKNKIAGIYFLHAKVTVDGKTTAQLDIACALVPQ